MAKITYQISNGTGGEISPRLDGRTDVAKQRNGLRVCENFQVVVHGGFRKRSGTKYVVELKSGSDNVILQDFQYSTDQAYMLVFGPSYIWILKDRGILTNTATNISGITKANPGVVTSASHGLSNGDRVIISSVSGMTEVNNRQFVVANKTTDTFELSGVSTSSYTTYSGSGTVAKIIEVTTSYAADELQDLRFAQYNDILYITHQNHPLAKLVRNSETSWTLSDVEITTGPFRTINADDDLRITPSSFSGSATAYGTHVKGQSCTLTASSAYFTSSMVGALFRLNEDGGGTGVSGAPLGETTDNTLFDGLVYTYDGKVYGISDKGGTRTDWKFINRVPNHDRGTVKVIGAKGASDTVFNANFLHPTYCIVEITGYTSSTVVTAEIVRYQMPKTIVDGGTVFWEEGAWSDERGYPRACAFFEQRLFLGGSDSDPTVVWSSKSAAFEDFSDGPDDDDALLYRAASGRADVIRWLSGGRVLAAGTSAGEYALGASNQNEALTPDNMRMLLQTNYGTSDCPPVRVNEAVLYPQRDGEPANPARKLREYTYDFTSDKFNSVDITVFAEHITGSGITRMAYQMQPDPMVWCVRADGELAVCTYERLQEVVAWQRHTLGGNGLAKTVGVCAGAAGDDVWVVVEREINSSTVRYVEVVMPPFEPSIHVKEDAVMVDASLTYSGSSTSTITGLWHLRGEDVKVLNNGNVEEQTVSATGGLTFDVATTKAHIGLAYTGKVVTQDLDGGAQAGSAQSRMKRVSQVYARVYGSLGGKVGKKDGTLDDLLYRDVDDVMGSSPDLYSGLIETDVEVGHDREAILEFQHDDPLPFFITAIVAELNTQG